MNPLFDLPEEQRAKLLMWLRECPYDDAVQQMLRDQGITNATRAQMDDFFQFEVTQHWEKRIGRAAQEADALLQLVEKSPVRFSAGILAALGQEAFRQIASGRMEPDAMGKLATFFLKARSDERADQMQELKREKLRRELQGQIDHALEKLAEEVDRIRWRGKRLRRCARNWRRAWRRRCEDERNKNNGITKFTELTEFMKNKNTKDGRKGNEVAPTSAFPSSCGGQ